MERQPETYQELLIRVIASSGLSTREISKLSGVNESSLSRFLNHKQELKADDYFAVAGVMPLELRKKLWAGLGRAFCGQSQADLYVPAIDQIGSMSNRELVDLMKAIADQLSRAVASQEAA